MKSISPGPETPDGTAGYVVYSDCKLGEDVTSEQFYNAFKDMSGSIVFAQWNGSNGLTEVEIDPPTNTVTNVTLVDTDISLNIMYRYGIMPKRAVGAITQIPTFWINTRTDNGIPSNITDVAPFNNGP